MLAESIWGLGGVVCGSPMHTAAESRLRGNKLASPHGNESYGESLPSSACARM